MVSRTMVSRFCLNLINQVLSALIRFCSGLRRDWDSNPRNTVFGVHRISNAAHLANSDTSPLYLITVTETGCTFTEFASLISEPSFLIKCKELKYIFPEPTPIALNENVHAVPVAILRT